MGREGERKKKVYHLEFWILKLAIAQLDVLHQKPALSTRAKEGGHEPDKPLIGKEPVLAKSANG